MRGSNFEILARAICFSQVNDFSSESRSACNRFLLKEFTGVNWGEGGGPEISFYRRNKTKKTISFARGDLTLPPEMRGKPPELAGWLADCRSDVTISNLFFWNMSFVKQNPGKRGAVLEIFPIPR